MAERTNPHANLIIGAQDEASPVFEQVGASAKRMADAVKGANEQAGKSSKQFNEELKGSKNEMQGLSDPAVPAAQTFDKATSSMIRQVQRLNAELEAGGARNAAYFEKMASVKGADLSAMAPYLADLKKAEAAQRVATTGLDHMGMSAKQTAAALRQVPMQFTDIVVSLQGGQSAMQVFLQQGGQLKDMFGGAGNAARALGGYVLGLVNPFTIAAAAVAGIAVAYNQGAKEADGYRMALVMTGNAAGTTAAQMQQMAGRISSVVGTQGAAAEALAQMASSGRVASQSLEYFSEVAIKFERTTGTAISETVKRFAELGASPVDASRKLNEETNYLTASIYEQIKALKDQGREADAAALAQNTYADALNNRSAQITQNLGAIEGAWKAIKDAAKSGWDAMLNVGRADSLGTQIDNMRAKIAQAKGQDKNRPFSMPWDTSLADLEKQLSFLTEQERVIRRGAEAQAQRTQAEKEAIAATDALQKTQASGLTNQQKMNKALEEYARHIEKLKATNPASVLLSPDAIARGEKAIRDQFSDKGKGSAGIKAVNKDLADQQRIFAELAGVSSTYYKELAAAQEQRAKGNVSEAQYVAYVNDLVQKQPFAVALAKEEAKAQQTLSKANLDAAASREKYITSLSTGLDKIQADIAAQIESTERMGLSKEAIAELDAAKLEMLATDLELQAVKAMDRNLDQQTYDALKQQAQAYRELGIAKKGGAAKEAALDLEKANAEAAKKAQEDWERASEQINSTLTDALMRGFESGKDFAKNLRDTVVNMFKTMVLRPVISAVLSPVSMALSGLTGAGSAAASQAGGSALGSAGGSLMGSALGGIGAFGTGASYGAASLFANGLTGTLAAGGQMIGAGSVMSGLGTISGALGPIAIGIALIASLIKKSTPHMGAASTYSEAGGLVSNADIYRDSGLADVRTYNAGVEQVTGNVAKAIGDTLNATAKSFGKTAGYEITTAFADDTSKDGAWGSLIIKQMGEAVIDWRGTQTSKWAPKEFADGEQGGKEYLAAVAKSARDALVTAIGDVDWATGMLRALGEAPTLEGLAGVVEKINAAKAAFVGFGQYMPVFAAQSDAAVSALVKASGGVDALAGNMAVFVDGFYTDAEKLAINTENVRTAIEALGLEMPTTRAEYKAMVQAQIALGDAGATTTAGLLAVSGAFAAVVPAVDAISEAMRRLQSETSSLEVDLLRAQGDTTGADAAQRAIDTEGLTAAEIAVYDYNQALRAQIEALGQASAASVAAESERAGLLDRWDAAVDDSVRLRDRERNAIAQANLALWDQVTAMEALKEATQANAAGKDTFDKTYTTTQEQRDALQTVINDTFSMLKIEAPESVDSYKALESYFGNLAKQAKFAFEALGSSRGTAISLINTGKAVDEKGVLQDYAYWDKRITEMTGVTARPTSVEGFDALVTQLGQTANDAAGDYTALLKASEAYAALNKIADGVPESVGNAADAIGNLSNALAQQTADMLDRIFELENAGNTSALQGRELGKLDPTLRPLQERIWALEREAVVMGEQKSILDQINQLTMTSEQLRKLERNALDESNRALFDRLTGLQAAAAVERERAGLQDELNRIVMSEDRLLALRRETLNESNRALFDQIQVATKEKALEAERAGLQDRINGLTLGTAALRDLEVSKLDASNGALLRRIFALEDEKRVADERAGLQEQINQLTLSTVELRALEIAKLDASNRPMQERIWLLEEEKRVAEERNNLMTSLYQAVGNTGALRADQLKQLDPANRALQEQVWQIEDAKTALEKALQAERTSAQAAQQAAQERVSTLKSIFDTLKSNVDSLYDSVEATKAWGAAQANAFIDNALGNARATGYMPEADDLADAISGARGGLDKEYATEFEKQRDTLVLAGKLAELQGISGEQLSAAERQLKASEAQVEALDGMQAQGKALLESLSGNTAATLSIADAIANLSAAITGVDPGAAGGVLDGASAYTGSPEEDEARGVFGGVRPSIINAAVAGAGIDPAAQALAALKAAYGGGMDARLYDKYVSGAGFENTLVDVPGYADWLLETGKVDEDWLRRAGIPGFAVGTNYVPRDMLAQIHEGEAIVPKAYNPAAGGGTQSNARLEALIEGLTSRVQALQSELVAIKTNTSSMAENLDEVTEGGNAMRSRAVGVTA